MDLLEGAKRSPKETVRRGAPLVVRLRAVNNHAAASIALRAMGDAARMAATMPESIAYLEDSIAEAQKAADPQLEAEAKLTLAGSQAIGGDVEAALATLDEAADVAKGLLAAQIGFQRGATLARSARQEEALEAFDVVLPLFRAANDKPFIAMTLHNIGNLEAFSGKLDSAQSHLSSAAAIFEQLHLDSSVAGVKHSLGVVATYRGDLPEAVALFNESEDQLRGLVGDVAEVQVSRCEALLAAGLFVDARDLAIKIKRELRRAGLVADEAEAAMVLAQAALLAGDVERARSVADEAVSLAVSQDRPGWVANARLIRLKAEVEASGATARHRSQAQALARELSDAGQFIPAANAALMAARLGIEMGDVDGAEQDLVGVIRHRGRGPLELRIQAWLGDALLRQARGDLRGADTAARAGMRVLAQYQAAVGATDVRVGVAHHGTELGELGLGLARDSRRPRRVWSWMERTRAGALRFRPIRPPADSKLASSLAELRRINATLSGATTADVAHVQKRQQELQQEVRRRSHEVGGDGSGSAGWVSMGAVLERLGDRRLVELGVVGGTLISVTLADGRARYRELGPVEPVELAFAAVRLALGRLTRFPSEANVALVRKSSQRLDDLLVVPHRLPDGPLIMVPPARLLNIPWSLLPSLAGTAVSIAPSAALWVDAQARSSSGAVVLAAGPQLEFASIEVRDLARMYAGAQSFNSRTSKVVDVLSAIDGARLVHLASHGYFRSDNPLFSSLHLADGDLTVFDIQGLNQVPGVMVLSACGSGLSAERPGNELLGLSGALLASGTRTLIASIGLVPDTTATRRLVKEFHVGMIKGMAPAEALAAAQVGLSSTPEGYTASAAFLCFGAG